MLLAIPLAVLAVGPAADTVRVVCALHNGSVWRAGSMKASFALIVSALVVFAVTVYAMAAPAESDTLFTIKTGECYPYGNTLTPPFVFTVATVGDSCVGRINAVQVVPSLTRIPHDKAPVATDRGMAEFRIDNAGHRKEMALREQGFSRERIVQELSKFYREQAAWVDSVHEQDSALLVWWKGDRGPTMHCLSSGQPSLSPRQVVKAALESYAATLKAGGLLIIAEGGNSYSVNPRRITVAHEDIARARRNRGEPLRLLPPLYAREFADPIPVSIH